MRIALVAPIVYPVPPKGYGGTERVVDLLARGLSARGQDVTVFAAAGSRPDLPLAPGAPEPLPERDAEAYAEAETAHIRRAYARSREFDVIHDHTKFRGLELADESAVPVLTTLHNPVTSPLAAIYSRRSGHPWVAISQAQAHLTPGLHFAGIVPHGIDAGLYRFIENKSDYLLSLGRITANKGVHHAIDVAKATGRRLIIAGPIAEDEGSEEYFNHAIKPHLDGEQITHVGAVGGATKLRLFAEASAFLFPIEWEEPFGLVVVEALASGTPVLALGRGAVPEILTDERVGLAVDRPEDLVPALDQVLKCQPLDCRTHVLKHFSAERMADDYLSVYRHVLAETYGRRTA